MSMPQQSARPGGAGGRRSPFAGADVCAAAGLRITPGGHGVLFDQDVWHFGDVEGLPAHLAISRLRFDFTSVTDRRWRLLAKEYIFARLAPADPAVAVLPAAYRVPLTLSTCAHRLAEAASWLNWLAGQQAESLSDVTQDHCDRYLAERARRKNAGGQVTGTLDDSSLRVPAAVIIDLAGYGELFTADRYRDGFTPWQGRTSSQVTGMRSGGENKTPPLGRQILQPLLAAAFYLTDTLGAHVLALCEAVREDRRACAGLRSIQPGPGQLTAVLDQHVSSGRPLESTGDIHIRARLARGQDPSDPLLNVSFGALARAVGARQLDPELLAAARPAILDAVLRVGVARPWGRGADCVTPADGSAPVPWTVPLDAMGVRDLPGYLHTACLIITAAVTGMRSSELKELRAGCRRVTTSGAGLTRYRLAGKLVKGQGLGGIDEEWVVVEEADRAVALAEQLSDGDGEVFGRFCFNVRYPRFRDWVNGPAGQRLGLAPVPASPVNLRMMRRSLAQEIAYRPGGLLAAKIHLKHVSAATTEGYTSRPGGAQAKLLAEIGEHEASRNLGLILEEYRNYQAGIMPAGPGARELAAFFGSIDGQLAAGAPNVAATGQHLLNLLSKRADVLHLGAANFCWFSDPSRALCLILAGTPGADAPLIGTCDSARCPQATHHQRHRAVWADAVTTSTVFLGALGRTRKTEKARLQGEADRAQRVVDAIDAAGGNHPGQAEGEQPCPSPTASGSKPSSASGPPRPPC
jgi:hypothetical protein